MQRGRLSVPRPVQSPHTAPDFGTGWPQPPQPSQAQRAGIASEALSRGAAMRGVTIDAAWILGREDDLGSIRAGKIADFAILDGDPLTVSDDGLRDIKVMATVHAGVPYPVPH